MTLDLDTLRTAVAGNAVAFRCVTDYQPAGGPGDKVFPPTYQGGKYATEQRVNPKTGEPVDCVLLDSVQSQANRMELALLEAWRAKRIHLPVITVRFDKDEIHRWFQDPEVEAKGLVVTSLEAPHRAADAILRDSALEGVAFRKSDKGKVLDNADVRNATGLFGLNPTALVFGLWDSTGPRGGLGAKFQRALVSEMVGFGAVPGCRPSSRIDPLQIRKEAGPIFRGANGRDWALDPTQALKKGGKEVLWGKAGKEDVLWDPKKEQEQGKPSKINHGNVTPSLVSPDTNQALPGGFTIDHAKRITVISLPTLRRLRFPLGDEPVSDPKVDEAARSVLATLGLLAATLSLEGGADLRSRCQLVAESRPIWQLLDTPGEPPRDFAITGEDAAALFNEAVAQARDLGLPWEGEILLHPTEKLVRLVARSQELSLHQAEGDA